MGFQAWVKKVFLYSIGFGLVLAGACRIQIPQIALLLGLFFGWTAVVRLYLDINGKMTFVGDLLLFVTITTTLSLAVIFTPVICRVLPEVRSCPMARIRSGCAFLLFFSTGISAFSLWLWFRFQSMRTPSNAHQNEAT